MGIESRDPLRVGGNLMRMRASPGLTLIRVALALPAAAIAAGTTIPPAPELSPTQLQQLAQVTTWRITDHGLDLGYFVGCCQIPADAFNLMETGFAATLPNVWIDQPTYAAVLPAVQVLPDPPILLMTARESKTGVIRALTMDDLPAGRTTRLGGEPHDNDIELLDDAGRVLSSNAIALGFEGILSPAPGKKGAEIIQLDESSIQLALNYPPTTALVRFRKGTQVLLEVDPVSQTLRTEVEHLPDAGFVKNPAERRKALLAKVDAFETQLRQKAFRGALEKLRNDIRAHADDWLLATPKASLLSLIDRVDARVVARSAVK